MAGQIVQDNSCSAGATSHNRRRDLCGLTYIKSIYFSTQSCTSHQYAKISGTSLQTIDVSCVLLGEICFATQTIRQMVRPPKLPDGTKHYDSVDVKREPMPEHLHNKQTHTEFVVFDSTQAYPEYILEYTV